MTLYWMTGGPNHVLGQADYRQALSDLLDRWGPVQRVLAVPPDHTRMDSDAGAITRVAHDLLGDRLTDVMPALGTHEAMNESELLKMFGDLPQSLIRVHRYKTDVETLGWVDSDFVEQTTEGIYCKPWPAQVNRLISRGGHDLILSIGQVVPHEVIGMANYTKNIFIGTGGVAGIDDSHYLSALYGCERIMGRCDNPLRRILNRGAELFLQDIPIVYVLTVVESVPGVGPVVRGLFIGDDHSVFFKAGELAAQVNCFRLDTAPSKIVVWMDPDKYKKTWVGNKAIYRSRMAIADGGTIVVVAPGVSKFGEHADVDALIRKYGYRTTPEIMDAVRKNEDLGSHLSVAAHMVHGSTENRFRVEYCPGGLSADETNSVGYSYGDWKTAMDEYGLAGLQDGWHTSRSGEPFYFIRNPGLGLWMHRGHPHAF
ncbi:MAG: lactate racemase domain-containing protein [Planctomycetota bacterium]|jgi:nickel-dependent lactate racemase